MLIEPWEPGDPDSGRRHNAVLVGLHIAFALFLLAMSFLVHGRLPGFTADESAAMGYLLFFGLGLPAFLIATAVCVLSVLRGGSQLGLLALALVISSALAVFSPWTGVMAALAYFSFAIWVLISSGHS